MAVSNPVGALRGAAKGQEVGSSIPANIVAEIGQQCAAWTRDALASCTMKRMPSTYLDARAELEIYDASGTLVIHGRDFGGGNRIYFWLA